MSGRASDCKNLATKFPYGYNKAWAGYSPKYPVGLLIRLRQRRMGNLVIHENKTYDGHKRPDKKWRNQFTGDRVRVVTWNVGSMTGRAGEVVDVLHRRHIDVCCIQETRWKGNGTRMINKTSEKYKFFWQGGNDGKAGVGVLVAEKLVDKVVEVRRLDNQIMVIKMIFDWKKRKIYFGTVYWGVTSRLANEEGIILAGDLNGHVGVSSEGYEGVHGGFSYGMRNLEGERILEFSDAMDMIVCNTMFKKESEKLVTYKSGSTKSAVDYLLLRRCDRCILKNVKVIPGEECINQHRLVVGDLTLKGARVTKRKFVPRLKV
ncbi:craniofacial development protein 2-like [Gordionus sp. m RMFG-2023]|uniref:craniofacial development protein 2-like n=1 Tax=Gordionus sp. m RMFG-2023 TaxID=3053472 RepID=UPI0031FBFD4C